MKKYFIMLMFAIIGCFVTQSAQANHYDLALLGAAAQGDVDSVETLLNNGADVNYCMLKKYNALNYAVYGNHIDVVKKLLDSGADVNYVTVTCGTALDIAVHFGYDEIAQMLVDHGANPNRLKVFGDCFNDYIDALASSPVTKAGLIVIGAYKLYKYGL